jgi:hypothetical protein
MPIEWDYSDGHAKYEIAFYDWFEFSYFDWELEDEDDEGAD